MVKDARKIKDLLYEQVARIGKVFSSPKRLELIELLCQGEKTVETLAREASISMKLASAHLRELRGAHLVETERRGKNILYRLANKAVADLWVQSIRLPKIAWSNCKWNYRKSLRNRMIWCPMIVRR